MCIYTVWGFCWFDCLRQYLAQVVLRETPVVPASASAVLGLGACGSTCLTSVLVYLFPSWRGNTFLLASMFSDSSSLLLRPCMDLSATPMESGKAKGTRMRNKGISQGALMVFIPLLLFPLESSLMSKADEALSLQCLLGQEIQLSLELCCSDYTCCVGCFQVNICEETSS